MTYKAGETLSLSLPPAPPAPSLPLISKVPLPAQQGSFLHWAPAHAVPPAWNTVPHTSSSLTPSRHLGLCSDVTSSEGPSLALLFHKTHPHLPWLQALNLCSALFFLTALSTNIIA